MNTELVKQEIENITSEVSQPIRKQYPISKRQERELEELGILELMPRQYGEIGYTNAAKVLESAKQGSTAVMDASDEGSEIAASKLYQLLNEPEIEETQDSEPQFVAMTKIHPQTGWIFLAEGVTEAEARDKGLDAICLNWQYATIYDVTKRNNMRIVTMSKARQFGYGQDDWFDESDLVDSEDFGAY